MRFIVQVRIEPDTTTSDATESVGGNVVDVAVVERGELSSATVGLSVEDAKTILAGVQDTVVAEHCEAALEAVVCCEHCGRRFAHKDDRQLVVRTLYGRMTVVNPRWWTCRCQGARRVFTPLARLLPERSTPELVLVEAKLAAQVPYRTAGRFLEDLLPVGRRIHPSEPHQHIQRIGERLDRELDDHAAGGERWLADVSGCSMRALPRPEMPLVVTIDGGYVPSSEQTSRRDGWFQAVCGTVTRHDGRVRRFGFVPNVDKHPRRRIHETLDAQGMQPNQLVTPL